MDMERGAKVSGSRFYYLRGKLAILERAIMQFALDTMVAKGFELMLPPILVGEQAMYGTGFFPADKNEVYSVNPEDDNLFLIGTSEVPLVFYHSNETLEEADLPKKYVAITPCFRREAGSYGKDTKGLFRVHQFYKVEMVVLTTPENSVQTHDELLGFEEEFLSALGFHYQVVNICSGDLGFPAAKKYDCEGWFPGQGRFRELTSTSNTTDYQARRSVIKYKTKSGERALVHTLNGTVTSDRPLLAVIENYQQADGSVIIPEVLRKYTGFDKI
jgi:seryl-tRNA synthetase